MKFEYSILGLRKMELFMEFNMLGLSYREGFLSKDDNNCPICWGLRKGMRYSPKDEQKGGPLLETLT